MRRTRSETTFEQYLESVRLTDVRHEPRDEFPGREKVPDYRVRHGGVRVLFEVKETAPSREIPQGGSVDPYPSVRRLVGRGVSKFKEYGTERCAVVLMNNGTLPSFLGDSMVMAGVMLGEPVIQIPVSGEGPRGEARTVYGAEDPGFFIDRKTRRRFAPHIGAVIVLQDALVGKLRVAAHVARIKEEEGRDLTAEEWFDLPSGMTRRVLRTVVYENPFSDEAHRLPRSWFSGPCDEIWGVDAGRYTTVHRGPEAEEVYGG